MDTYQREPVNDERRFWKYLIFGILTLGIYDIWFMWTMINDMNKACGHVEEDDSYRSPHYLIFLLLNLVTLGIYSWFWWYRQGNRLKRVGNQYGIEIDEKGSTYLLWNILGALLFGIGPLVAFYLLIANCNKICRKYNERINNPQVQLPPDWGETPSQSPSGWGGTSSQPPSGGMAIPPDEGRKVSLSKSGLDDTIVDRTVFTPRQGTIRCEQGVYKGANLPIASGQEIVIGRNSDISHLVLTDKDISRKHVAIRYSYEDGGYYYVTDYSSQGTRINGSIKMTGGKVTKCPPGTILSLGSGVNVFRLL